MNVGLATQALNSSVATATDFLQKGSSLSEFNGSEVTDFIRKADVEFDKLSSRMTNLHPTC